ncbi:hypothetical protein D3C76_1035880 [compost metagenome]
MCEQGLVTRGRQFVGSRQVDPQLCHLQRSTGATEFGRVVLFMENPGSCCHPLHVTGADLPTCACGVTVLHTALVNDRHGFKTPVGVLADAPAMAGCREIGRAGVVE